jgi:serine/threonine-protein kinase
MAEPFAWGSTLKNKYRIETLLGRGGMGVVLGARHLGLDEPVAIKIMLPEMRSVPGAVERFLREARSVAKLKSPHVVRVYDVDTLSSGVPFIVMERLFGTDLATLCRNGRRLGIFEAVAHVIEAGNAIAEAHALGIVHRDLKPANLFLAQAPDGSAGIKVLDFGVSILLCPSEHQARITDVGQTLGSPTYMSPEQMLSSHDVDARTDIWALGAVLYRLICGVTPFRAEGVEKLRPLVLTMPAPRISETCPEVPQGLEAIILRCLEKDPDARYATATELVRALAVYAPANPQLGSGGALALSAPEAPRQFQPRESLPLTTTAAVRGAPSAWRNPIVIALATAFSLGSAVALVTLPFQDAIVGRPPASPLGSSAETGARACPSPPGSEQLAPLPSTAPKPIRPTILELPR